MCNVTQPTLSAGLKQLEGTLGVLLVTRGARFQSLTPEGERVLDWAKRIVGDVRTKGLMAAVELVADRATKTPVDKKTMAKVADAAYRAGVMIRVSSNNIILSPPLVLDSADVATIATALDAGFSAAASGNSL